MDNEFGYIGMKKIKSVEPDGVFVTITFEDDTTIRLHGHVYGIITTTEQVEASTNDLIFLCLAKEILAQLQEYDLLSYYVGGIAVNMTNLVENAQKSATIKLWGGKTSSQLTLNDVDKVLKQ